MKSLIIGSGLVGSALKKVLPDALVGRRDAMTGTSDVYLDLTIYDTLFKVFSEHRPDIVYLPAAITNVDKCEDKKTNDANVLGAFTVISLCEQFESKIVYFSSSYVFDGESKTPYPTTEVTNPISHYGNQKQLVERTILQSYAKKLVIRTVGVFGEEKGRKNFAKSVLHSLFQEKKVFVPNDQFMNPILSNELAKITVRLTEKHQGLFHVAGDTCVSKYEFARRLAKYFGQEHLIIPVTTEEAKQRAKRPKMGCLDCSSLKSVGLEAPSFEDGIVKFLELDYYS